MGRRWGAAVVATLLLGACVESDTPATVDTAGSAAPSSSAVAVRLDVDPVVDEAARNLGVDIEEVSRQAVMAAASRLPGRDADIVVTVSDDPNSMFVLGHLGLGARGSANGIQVVVDPDSPNLGDGLDRLALLLAHETHHVWRWSSDAGAPQGLLDLAVAEGLADHFAGEVYPEAEPSPWTDAIPDDKTTTWWRRMVRAHEPRVSTEVRAAWFFGDDDMPPWVGYTLGHRLVGASLERHSTTAAANWDTPWETVIDQAGSPWTVEGRPGR